MISRYATQIDCTQSGGEYHVNCGYMRAFVKRNEFFWTRLYSPTEGLAAAVHGSTGRQRASIAERAQIFEGQWTHDGTGIRPVATGFDRVITLGDMAWTDYEVRAEITFNSFDHVTAGRRFGRRAGARLAGPHRLGTAAVRASVRRSLPLRLGRGRAALLQAAARIQPGPAHDTIVAKQNDDLPLGVPHMFRFRERDLGNG